MNCDLLQTHDPSDYFTGIGKEKLPSPTNVLLFLRTTKDKLQQEARQNRSHHRFVLAFNLESKGHVHVNNLALPFDLGHAFIILPYQFHHFSLLNSMKIKWLFCTFELVPRTFLEPLRNRVVIVQEITTYAMKALLEE
jgi:AraC family transcriptional regulator